MVHPASRPHVHHLDVMLRPDPARTVVRPFLPADPPAFAREGVPRSTRIVERVLRSDPDRLRGEFQRVCASLDQRNRDVTALLQRRFDAVEAFVPAGATPSREQALLIGAYLSAEYSFEAAALFNPSAVLHPDQSGVAAGDSRILVSLRGIGEGHLSSVTFRTGIWTADDRLELDPASAVAVAPVVGPPEDGDGEEVVRLDCGGSRDPSETVLFPIVESQSGGIEDLRLTGFAQPGRAPIYAGTYTALGSGGIRQEMLWTDDFRRFEMYPVTGDLAPAKGMALFPRPVGGRYLALGRQDGESLWLASSDDLVRWSGGVRILEPAMPWEAIQIGNCGSPIEIEEGWLVLTHGVGVVRNYCMGAALLDRDDPARVIGRLHEPLLEPGPETRDGYVPNVVYSCGGIVRGRRLLLPYGVADNYASFATVSVDELVAAMRP